MPEPGTGKYERLLERCRSLAAVPTAVAHPCEESALAGAVEAGQKGLIEPIPVGPAAKIQEVARRRGSTLAGRRSSTRRIATRRRLERWSWCGRGRRSC